MLHTSPVMMYRSYLKTKILLLLVIQVCGLFCIEKDYPQQNRCILYYYLFSKQAMPTVFQIVCLVQHQCIYISLKSLCASSLLTLQLKYSSLLDHARAFRIISSKWLWCKSRRLSRNLMHGSL